MSSGITASAMRSVRYLSIDSSVKLKCFRQISSGNYLRQEGQTHSSGINFKHAVSKDHDRADFFKRVLQRFPGARDGNRVLSFAYGSGVFDQISHEPAKNNMTDFIFAVEDPVSWHKENLEKNPSDYPSAMRILGPKAIADIQQNYGSNLYFNTLVPFEEGQIKYGVITRADIISDLLDWDSLYASGRLHKPVRILEKKNKNEDQELNMALRMNLTSALHTSLLLLPERFSEEQLFMKIASLSYKGDFRMTVGEDKDKVRNIVLASLGNFRNLYRNRINKMTQFLHQKSEGTPFDQDISPAGRHHHLTMLPKNVQLRLVQVWNEDGRTRDVEDVLRAAAFDRDSGEIINSCIEMVVRTPALGQAVKGIATAGLYKSTLYVSAKLRKMMKSLKTPSEITY